MKDVDVMEQIESMLKDISGTDDAQYHIVIRLLSEVFMEYNSGVKRKVDQKLWDFIDAEIRLSSIKEK